MKFIGRREESERLERWWTTSSRFALIWGRRRVGKTALINHFTSGKRAVFYTGRGLPGAAELRSLATRVAAQIPGIRRDLAGANPYRDWDEALDHLAEQAVSTPTLLALDEFPELLKSEPALPGILRAFWDRWEGRTALKVLLCGSAVRAMFSLQDSREPLYGRFDLALQLHPFLPSESAAMLPDFDPADRARIWAVCGGMPLHLSMWDQAGSFQDNLLELACRPGAPLRTEATFVLKTEAGEGGLAEAVLHAVGQGATKYSEIQTAVGANPTRTLERLEELRLIRSVTPVTESARTRRRHYAIADNLLAFHLGPLSAFAEEIELGSGERIVGALTDASSEHFGTAFEEAFRAHLRRLAIEGLLGDRVVKVGPWWRGGGQDEIDAVVLAQPERTRIPILAGEAKWAKSVNANRIKAALAAKAAALGGGEALRYAVAAREEVRYGDDETFAFTAADIFTPELVPPRRCAG
ncbi:ATP-binding protein [Glycomyces paridis]|uniref:ATP-binding protein n=1 Tax=Glycomyces paridis TaxID=2126555 RepID=A0A4S8PJ18_9ACTN|nr:ATP-binding protein [Glycomyces paridis]THV29991.1 ATP-binding protein [Glycomyces paridis]